MQSQSSEVDGTNVAGDKIAVCARLKYGLAHTRRLGTVSQLIERFLPLVDLVNALWVLPLLGALGSTESSSSLARRVCVQSPTASVFSFVEYAFTDALKYVMSPGSSCGAEGNGGTAPLVVTGPSVALFVVSLLPVT